MAAPFAHEDLEKLKKFIEFVSANPLILNMPQLDFVRKFIEQFGGTIPVGDFQMPAGGGKCPFGGDAKPESKSEPAPEQDEPAPENMADEEESEESELELDMEEINVPLLEPNVLYLDVKPPKIVRNAKPPRKVRTKKMITKKFAVKKDPPKPTAKIKKTKRSPLDVATVKRELQRNIEESPGDDPLYMPNIEVKIEIEVGDAEVNVDHKPMLKFNPNDNTIDTDDLEKYDFSADEDEDYEVELKRDVGDCDEDVDSNEDDDDEYEDEDELLIMLTKRKVKAPRTVKCHEICKQQCSQKFSEEQRQRACDYFWSLSKERRVQYIRTHTKEKRYTRLKLIKSPIRGNHCCYFLDDNSCESGDMKRVCRKYFETTLCITSYTVKKALEGYTPEPVDEVKPLTEQEKEDRKKAIYNKPKEVRQILDPETGYLVTLNPNAKKVKPAEAKTKKKFIRRKPGDPQPEHNPKPIQCEIRCIYKCHLQFTPKERKQICDLFWSLDYKRRKEYVLARIETKEVVSQVIPEFRLSNRPPRTYQTRFFLSSVINGENKRVCKHFMMATLCINRHFITNALEFADKSTGSYVGSDRRGKTKAKSKGKPEYWQGILDHISSYPTWVPNNESKTRYLHHNLNIKLMYTDYKDMCMAQQKKGGSINSYYKAFHKDFHLSFLCSPGRKRGIGLMLLNPNISQYTGDEPDGYWVDPKGEKLDVNRCSRLDLTQSFLQFPRSLQQKLIPASTTAAVVTAASTTAAGWLCTTIANPP